MKQWLIAAIALLVVGGGGIGVGWFTNEWWNRDQSSGPAAESSPAPPSPAPAPAEYERRLTGTEAAAIVRSFQIEKFSREGNLDSAAAWIRASCEERDFNERNKTWIVSCGLSLSSGSVIDFTFRVDDATGRVELVR